MREVCAYVPIRTLGDIAVMLKKYKISRMVREICAYAPIRTLGDIVVMLKKYNVVYGVTEKLVPLLLLEPS